MAGCAPDITCRSIYIFLSYGVRDSHDAPSASAGLAAHLTSLAAVYIFLSYGVRYSHTAPSVSAALAATAFPATQQRGLLLPMSNAPGWQHVSDVGFLPIRQKITNWAHGGLNTLRPRHNGYYFADDNVKLFSLKIVKIWSNFDGYLFPRA